MLLVLSLGSNLGEPYRFLQNALEYLGAEYGKNVLISPVYQTSPWGMKEQPDFLNMAVAYETGLPVRDIFREIKAIETQVGRKPGQKWHAREIDIDIVFYGDQVVKENDLEIPHPKMSERLFVLKPLDDIIPNFNHPVLHKKVHELLLECSDTLEINLWNEKLM